MAQIFPVVASTAIKTAAVTSGYASTVAAMATLAQAASNVSQLRAQRKQEEFKGRIEEVNILADKVATNEELLEMLSSMNVEAAARGVKPSPRMREMAESKAAQELSTLNLNTLITASEREQKKSLLRKREKVTGIAGTISALETGYSPLRAKKKIG